VIRFKAAIWFPHIEQGGQASAARAFAQALRLGQGV